jgi:SAM-dependent methyltransferase
VQHSDIPQGFASVDASGGAGPYADYLDEAAEALAVVKRAALAHLALRKGDHVLDLGCGAGSDLLALADAVGPCGRVVGVDSSEALVRVARVRTAHNPAVHVQAADGLALPFPDGTFHATCTQRTLMHVEDPAGVVQQMARVTRKSGTIVLSEPDWDTLIIDSDDLTTARRVAKANADRAPNPDIGRRLGTLAYRAQLDVLEVNCTAVTFQDRHVADAVLLIQSAAESLTDHSVQQWWDRLGDDPQLRPFFAALTFVTVVARKPPNGRARDAVGA